jgi:inorganic triphosphatase YgiF
MPAVGGDETWSRPFERRYPVTSQALEIERKYELDAAVPLADLLTDLPGVAAVDGPHVHELDAVYYDTPDLRLARSKATLRRRTGGTDAGWHLKLPAGGQGERLEHRLPPGRAGRAVPAALVDLTLARTRGVRPAPVVRLRTTRTQWNLLDPDGAVLAELASDDVTAQTMGESSTISAWHEVEVELATGGRALLDAVEQRLSEVGARPSGSASKLSRALAERLAEVTPPAPELRSGSAGAVVLVHLRAQVDAITDQDPALRRDEPDSVHRLRVAARRARATLQSCRRVLDRERTDALVRELRWLGRVLAPARDAEVQRGRLLEQLGALPDELVVGPVVSRVDSHFLREYTEAREAALVQLRGARYLALLDALHELLAEPPLTRAGRRSARAVLPGEVRRAQRRVRRALAGEWSDHALHEARKAAKRARYVAELTAPVVGRRARRSAKRLKAVQTLLGHHQDSVVAAAVLRELGMRSHLDGENGFTPGVLLGRELVAAERLREELPAVWQRADARRTRAWQKR